MIPVRIESLMLGFIPSPSVLTLRPISNKKEDSTLPIWIGTSEATSIAAALESKKQKRPLTHNLLQNTIESLGAKIIRIVIDRVEGTVFYAKIILQKNNDTSFIKVDARPSDAIALAIHSEAPMFVEEKVFEAASAPISLVPGSEKKIEIEEFHKFIENVNPDDFITHQ